MDRGGRPLNAARATLSRVPNAANHVAAVAVLVLHAGRVLALRRAADAEAAPGVWEAL